MGGGDLGLGLGARGQQRCAHLVEAGVVLEEAARHLRLAGEAAEVDHGAGMREDLGADARHRAQRWRLQQC